MKNKANLFLMISGSIALVAVIVLIVLGGPDSNSSSASSSASFKKDDPKRPIAILQTKTIDWGNIKLADTKEGIVELKNDGNSPLEITKLSTSCGCTAVKATIDGKETKEYSMHQPLVDNLSIAPKSSASLKVIYRPFSMPIDGPVTRQVFIGTNDPNNAELEIDASAVVSK